MGSCSLCLMYVGVDIRTVAQGRRKGLTKTMNQQTQTQTQPQAQPRRWAAPFNSSAVVDLTPKERQYVRVMRSTDRIVWEELGNPYELGVLDGLKRGRMGCSGTRKVDW